MARKLSNIEQEVISAEHAFYDYLKHTLSNEMWYFLNKMISQTEIFLFSGVIRNYFINRRNDELRDIDFIISDDINVEILFPRMDIRKNSFGGYKLNIGGLTVDLWVIKNTWALNYGQLKLPFSQLEALPNTTFFNFSSIIFSINKKEFIVGKPFLRFLRDKKIDVVFEKNPYPALCIVNTFYYSDKFSINITDRLKSYILSNYEYYKADLDKVQIKHFGKILYSKDELYSRITNLRQDAAPESNN